MATTNKPGAKKHDPFAKKVPQNPKYKHVKCTVDTGASLSNYMKKIDEIRKNYRFRNDEIFKRMKASTFAQLVLQVAQVVNMELEQQRLDASTSSDSVLGEACDLPSPGRSFNAGSETSRSTLQSVIGGLGEVDINAENRNRLSARPATQEAPICTAPDPLSLPYILLDVRERDEFEKCHVIGALNYPATLLTRSVNYFSKEILCFKNKPGKIIILYDEDERVASHVATVMVQRELDNVIMLSGGMKVLHKKFPGCFLSGTLPAACFSPETERKGSLKPAPIVKQNAEVAWFSPELLEEMSSRLDELLLSNESSRMSSRASSTTSSKGGSTARSDKSTVSQKAWK